MKYMLCELDFCFPLFLYFFLCSKYLSCATAAVLLVGEWSHGDRRRIAKPCRLTDQKLVENDFHSSHRTVTIMQPQPLTQPSFRQVTSKHSLR